MSDTFEAHSDRVAEFQSRLKPVEGAVGLAVAIGKQIVSIDLLDKPATCSRIWVRLLTGYVLDALEVEAPDESVTKSDAEAVLGRLRDLPWSQTQESLGEGEDFRAETDDGVFGSALALDGELIHGSVSFAAP